MTTTMLAMTMSISRPTVSKLDTPRPVMTRKVMVTTIPWVDAADNVLKEDESEPTIDEDDDEAGLNLIEVEDLNDHGRNGKPTWQKRRHYSPPPFQ
jgi:hypothetical protein